jgi:hypothetical protein
LTQQAEMGTLQMALRLEPKLCGCRSAETDVSKRRFKTTATSFADPEMFRQIRTKT